MANGQDFYPDTSSSARPAFIPHTDAPDFIADSPARSSAQTANPLDALSNATGIGAAPPLSWWDRLKNAVTADVPYFHPENYTSRRSYAPMQLIAPEAAMTPAEQQRHPILTGASQFAGGLTSPENTLMLAGTAGFGELPAVARGMGLTPNLARMIPRLVSAGFSAQMLKGAYDAYPEFKKAVDANDTSEALRIGTQMALSTALGVHTGVRALGPSTKPTATSPDVSIDPSNAPSAPSIQPETLPTLPEALANASGESSASLEAINRNASELSQGIKRVRIDTRSGNEIPLIGTDAVDAKAGLYDRVVQRYPDGREITLDEGAKARPFSSGMGSGTPAFPLVGKELPASKVGVYDLGDIDAKSPADLVRDAGLVYKGEFPGTGVHQFEDSAYPGKTAALRASDMTSASAIREKMNAKLAEFGVDPKTLPSIPTVASTQPNAADTTPVQRPSFIQRGFEKWADVRSHDTEIADSLQQLDNAPNYYRAKAQNALRTILGEGESRLTPEQERLFTLMADSDSRENLYKAHPEEYAQAQNDPAIQSALERYKPYEQELTVARQKLGGGTLEGDYLARIYEEHTGERLPGTGQRRIGIQNENAPYSPERTASAEYFYQSGLHELEPSFAPKYVATNLRLLRDQLVENFTSKATRLERGQELPDLIQYAGREYSKPDLTLGAKSQAMDYSVYDSPDGRYIGPKAVVAALRDYDPVAARSGAQLGPIRSWLQKQVLLSGFGIPHAMNIMRRVAAEAPLGTADPRGWINATRVVFGKELRARGLKGLNDPTFDSLAKNGALSANEVTQLKKYWGQNLNPLSWAESALRPGKKLLFEPGTLGGLGGLDQRARLWLADRIRAERPNLSDAAIAREINTTLGSYSRTNWTDFQKKLSFYLLFPGWDHSSIHYTLTHPVKSAVPPAVLNLLANATLARLGQQKDPNDAVDPFSVHIGDHSISSALTREAMAVHLARPLWNAAIEAYHGRPFVEAGGKQAVREGLHLLRPDISGLVALGASAANLNIPGATVYSRDDVLAPGRILPNKALEKVAAFAILKGNPLADRLLSGDTGHLDQTLQTYQDALSGNKDALKTLGTWAAHSALSSAGIYDYRRDAEQRLLSQARAARLVNYEISRYYTTGHPEKATALMSDPQNAALAMFQADFSSLSRGLRELNDAYDRAKTDSDRKQIESARKQLLANSELLMDVFTQAETNKWQRRDTARKAAQRAATPDFIPASQ